MNSSKLATAIAMRSSPLGIGLKHPEVRILPQDQVHEWEMPPANLVRITPYVMGSSAPMHDKEADIARLICYLVAKNSGKCVGGTLYVTVVEGSYVNGQALLSLAVRQGDTLTPILNSDFFM